MLTFRGISALSDFRKQKLLERLRRIDGGIQSVDAEYIHFVDVATKLNDHELKVLKKLITYGEPYIKAINGVEVLVVPRPGTISPWSSKATDILHNSGLNSIRRIERGVAYHIAGADKSSFVKINQMLFDRMTEAIFNTEDDAAVMFTSSEPKKLGAVDIQKDGLTALKKFNVEMGLALSDNEMAYLIDSFREFDRNPTDVELMMFAQLNSEHCRHKVFNANWTVDGKRQPKSLFSMIRNTNEKSGDGVLSAYKDNAAVLQGPIAERFFARPDNGNEYESTTEPVNMVIKVETHNHPTAIAPVPGAATGTGGEIRDEAATGRGAKSKMGLAGYTVSNLHIPGNTEPWEINYGKPDRMASALDIMLDAPIGAASFANEFGRPALAGYFRTYEQESEGTVWGYHKPIMIAGGLGNIRDAHVQKRAVPEGGYIIALGGPAMLIGLGGGAASSMQSGSSSNDLDFASVQRGNGEMERRAQEVIDSCWALGEDNPIKAIHDVGAGGWSVSIPELIKDNRSGAVIDLRKLPNAEPDMSPLQIWCNESQERYVLTVDPAGLDRLESFCERERCPISIVGTLRKQPQLTVSDSLFHNTPIDMPMDVLLGRLSTMERSFGRTTNRTDTISLNEITVEESIRRVLRLPSVGSKQFLITIGDRTVSGLVARDQMVGPWQVPVSDVAVTSTSFTGTSGEAMAVGERTPLATLDAPASARMAIGEAITNLMAADINAMADIKLSANWMAAVGYKNEDERLFDSVKSVGQEFCPAIGISIPVGKDSLSMRSTWQDGKTEKSVTSPMSVIITAFAGVTDVNDTLTPYMRDINTSELVYIDVGHGKNRLGGSALSQVFNLTGGDAPDIDPDTLKDYFDVMRSLRRDGLVLAYHDRSDGGLLATITEMAFASRAGMDINLTEIPGSTIEKLFTEELGAVIQVCSSDIDAVLAKFVKLKNIAVHHIGRPTKEQKILIADNGNNYQFKRAELEREWSTTSFALQKLRDNPECADEERSLIAEDSYSGLVPNVTFKLGRSNFTHRPKVAILREEGVNGNVEMAAAFHKAGFTSVDVHLNDLLMGTRDLKDYRGIVACGGFSYGDVLGAGEGWAKSILYHPELKHAFENFFAQKDCFSFGVCNGCQMFVALKSLIPGTELWPDVMLKNRSEQFEARLVQTVINKTPSLLFVGMEGSVLPIPVAHGEGRAQFAGKKLDLAKNDGLITAQFVDGYHGVTQTYPLNPNGSPDGIAAMTSSDGRSTIIMPHPERVFLTKQLSWHPTEWGEDSPWFQLFTNARKWVG